MYRIIILIIIWCYHAPYLDCAGGQLQQIFLGGVISLLLITNGVIIILIKYSMKGTIMDDRPRKCIPNIIYIRYYLALLILLLILMHFIILQSFFRNFRSWLEHCWCFLGI